MKNNLIFYFHEQQPRVSGSRQLKSHCGIFPEQRKGGGMKAVKEKDKCFLEGKEGERKDCHMGGGFQISTRSNPD